MGYYQYEYEYFSPLTHGEPSQLVLIASYCLNSFSSYPLGYELLS
jgi:hypothetical protein